MAIAPSKLGQFVHRDWGSDEALPRGLREAGLVKERVADEKLMAVFRKAREEHAALPAGQQAFNSPHERVRVFLERYLTNKGSSGRCHSIR